MFSGFFSHFVDDLDMVDGLANLSQILHLPPHCCTECKSQWWRPCWSPRRAPLLYPACKISISQKGKNHILHYHYVKATCYWAYSQLRNTAGPPRVWEERGSVGLSLFLLRGKDEAAPRPWRHPVRSGLKMILIWYLIWMHLQRVLWTVRLSRVPARQRLL